MSIQESLGNFQSDLESVRQPLRILYTINTFPGYGYTGGGAEQVAKKVTSGLMEAYPDDYNFTVYVNASADDGENQSLQEHIIPAGTNYGLIKHLYRKRYHYDLLQMGDHSFVKNPALLLSLQSFWTRPTILRLMSHSFVIKLSRLPKALALRYLSPITRFIAQSNEIATGLEEYGINQDKIVIINNGVDTQFYSPDTDRNSRELKRYHLFPDLPENGMIAAYVGRITPELKRVDRLLKSWVDGGFADRGHQLLLVGPYEGLNVPGGKDLYRQYGKTGSPYGQSNTYWPGAVDSHTVALLLRLSDVFILPSDIEGFSNSLAEAMSTGVPPVVKAEVSGNNDLVKNGETGLTFGEDGPNLEDQLRMMENHQLREELGRNARQHIIQNFTLEKMIGNYHNLYQSLA